MIRRVWLVALALVTVAAVSTCAPAAQAETVTHLEYLRVVNGRTPAVSVAAEAGYGRWASNTVRVHDGTDGGWRIAEAAAEWDARTPLTVQMVGPCTGCIRVTEADNLGFGIGGLAHITTSGGIVTDVWIELVRAFQYPHPVADTVESHELGHGFGLPHSTTGRAVMYPVAGYDSPGEPTAPDRRALRALGY